jgi:hypothetical protein
MGAFPRPRIRHRKYLQTGATLALAQKNNVRLIDGTELARLETARQASGDET